MRFEGYTTRFQSRRASVQYCAELDEWLLLFKRLAHSDEDGKIHTTRVFLTDEAMAAIIEMQRRIIRDRASIPNPRRDDSEMAGRSGNLSDLTDG